MGLYQQFIQAEALVRAFLEILRSARGPVPRVVGTCVAYMIHHIWLARSSLVFESRRCSVRLTLEKARILAMELTNITFRPPKI